MKKNLILFIAIFILSLTFAQSFSFAIAEENKNVSSTTNSISAVNPYTIFDDKTLLDGYTEKYNNFSKFVLLEMVQDDSLSSYQIAAAVRAFKQKYSKEIVSDEKTSTERILLRRLNINTSPFVQTEIMHTLCKIDRYKYFESMFPIIIQKLTHYNKVVNDIAFESLNDLIQTGNNRPREARIVFNMLRKILFLSRKTLADVQEPNEKLKKQLSILRWSIKVLGIQELQKLPKEVLDLL